MTKEISRRQFLRVSAVAGAGAVLAACGGTAAPADPSEGSGSDVPATATPNVEAMEPTEVPEEERVWPRDDVPRERTLVFMFGGPEYAYTGIGNPYARTHQDGQASMMEFMFYYAALADKTYPWLAESYEYNDDATEITVYLRKGAYWADGEAFDANDVVYTYTMLKQYAPLLQDSSFVDNAVESVEAVDDHTVHFVLKEPLWRFHFTHLTARFDRGIYLVPEHVWSQADLGEDPLEYLWYDEEKLWPLHTGPYSQTRLEATVQNYDLRYNWWAKDVGLVERMPRVERITVIPFTTDELAAQSVINDDVDVTLDLRPQTISAILDQASDHVVSFTGLEKPYGYVDWWPISMYFNTLEAPYDDPKVRWAVAYAINQQTLVDVGWDGAGRVTAHPFPEYPRLMGFLEGAQSVFDEYNVLAHDVDMTEQLMTEAGYTKNADGFWADESGAPLYADIDAAVPLFGDIAPITAELMRQAGFNANHVTPPDVWDRKADGRAILHLFGHGGSVYDPYITLQMYHSRWQTPTGENCGDNRPRWGNEEYDALIDEMARTPVDDMEKMQDLFNQAMEIWYRELPEVPLVQWFHRLAMNATYWTNWPNQDNPYNSAPWHNTFPITLWNLEPTQ